MKTKSIKQNISFKVSAQAVFDALMDSKKHSTLVGAGAKISKKIGGRINVWDGDITGNNIELVKGKKIVQEWRYSDWPRGRVSIATFLFKKVKGGTKLIFTQKGIPEDKFTDIKQGWIDYYWTPLKEMLER